MTGADEEMVRLVPEAFCEDGDQSIAGIGDAAAIDDLEILLGISGFQGQLDRPGTPLLHRNVLHDLARAGPGNRISPAEIRGR